jgi:hypothetical protein
MISPAPLQEPGRTAKRLLVDDFVTHRMRRTDEKEEVARGGVA